ncbi:MAG TPA: hypothetical protein VGG07_10280, partial [Solirubrobacteraceae bacterium]
MAHHDQPSQQGQVTMRTNTVTDSPADVSRHALAGAPNALAFLAALRADADNASAARRAASDELAALRAERQPIAAELARRDGRSVPVIIGRRDLPPEIGERGSPDWKLADIDRRIAEVQARLDRVGGKPLRTLVTRLDRFLAGQRGPLVDVPLPPTRGKTLTAVRAQIAQLDADERAVRAAPEPRAAQVARVETEIAALARSVRWRDGGFASRSEVMQLRHAATVGEPPAQVTGLVVREAPDTVAILAAMFPERMVEMVAATLPPDSSDAIGDGDRARRLAALARERLALEHLEEALVREALADRRPDAS